MTVFRVLNESLALFFYCIISLLTTTKKGGENVKAIAELIDLMDDELENAKEYAERFIMMSTNNDDYAKKFKTMSEESLNHSTIIYTLIVREINKLKAAYTPPVKMKEFWKQKEEKYIEKSAWIKQMLSL